MKKNAIYYFSLAAILAGSFSSCREADLGFSAEEIAYAKFEKEYNENFEKDYGKIAPGHTWGFEIDTRAKTRATQEASHQYRVVRNSDGTARIESIIGGVDGDADYTYASKNYPPAITEAEKKYVFKYLAEHPNQGSTTCALDNYFLQNLGQYVENEYTTTPDQNGQTHQVKNTNNMNQLTFDQVHFQTYNASIGYDYYVTNTEIKDPQYHDNYGSSFILTDKSYRYYYIPGDPSINFPGGCYLCFDYITTNKDDKSKYLGDGVYNDWVIKIYPGENDLGRVFCEDLGSTLDLDFNDLVFDYCNYGTTANPNVYIQVRALLGTLEIDIENHVIRSADDMTIHDNVNGPSFFIDKLVTTEGLIWVKGDNNRFPGSNGWNKSTWNIYNNPGKAPYMLRVAPNTPWTAENQRIDDKYPNFKEYVVAPEKQPTWWKN